MITHIRPSSLKSFDSDSSAKSLPRLLVSPANSTPAGCLPDLVITVANFSSKIGPRTCDNRSVSFRLLASEYGRYQGEGNHAQR